MAVELIDRNALWLIGTPFRLNCWWMRSFWRWWSSSNLLSHKDVPSSDVSARDSCSDQHCLRSSNVRATTDSPRRYVWVVAVLTRFGRGSSDQVHLVFPQLTDVRRCHATVETQQRIQPESRLHRREDLANVVEVVLLHGLGVTLNFRSCRLRGSRSDGGTRDSGRTA